MLYHAIFCLFFFSCIFPPKLGLLTSFLFLWEFVKEFSSKLIFAVWSYNVMYVVLHLGNLFLCISTQLLKFIDLLETVSPSSYWERLDKVVSTELMKIKLPLVRLTNRFHVAVRLFSNRSQMTSKCGKNKKVAHEAIAECVTDVLTTFWRLLWSITEQTHGNMESICFI